MKNFTLAQTEKMRKEMDEALAIIATKYGATAQLSKVKYGSNVTAQIEFSKVSDDGKSMTKDAETFLLYAQSIGISKDALYKKFSHAGSTYEITGYNTRRSKYPMTYTMDGKPYKSTVANMKSILRTNPELLSN